MYRKVVCRRSECYFGDGFGMEREQATAGNIRKRKADSQDNERLSKRLSLLNLGIYSPFLLI